MLPKPPKQSPLVEATIEFICRENNIRRESLIGESRLKIYSDPRMAAWYILCRVFHKTYSEIGRAFNRDHTTISHGCQAFEKRMLAGKVSLPERAREFINRHETDKIKEVRESAKVLEHLETMTIEHIQKLNRRINWARKKHPSKFIFGLEKLVNELEAQE